MYADVHAYYDVGWGGLLVVGLMVDR